MFDPSIPSKVGIKGTVPMAASVHGGATIQQTRPRGRIVGKDHPVQGYGGLTALPEGRTLVGYQGPLVGSPFGLQIRAGPELALVAQLPEAADPFSLSGNQLLASGPLFGGYQSSVCVVDLAAMAVLDTLPLCEPYLWLDGSGVIAQTPAFPDFMAGPLTDPTLIDRHPKLRRWVKQRPRRLLHVRADGKISHCLDAAEVAPEDPRFRHLALAPDGAMLFASTYCSVAAVSLADWTVRWRRRLGDPSGPQFLAIYATALSPDGRHLAVGGLAGYGNSDHALVILDATNGQPLTAADAVGPAIGSTSFRSLAWHDTEWLAAGTSSGLVAHLDLHGRLRTYKGAGRAVESLLSLYGAARRSPESSDTLG
jgi:hypothetical protein